MILAPDDLAVDGVTGGAGDIADDDALLTGDPVDQAGLAGVGLADDGNLDTLVLFDVVPGVLGQMGKAGVQQVAGAVAVEGGNAHRVAQTQVIELIELCGGMAGGVHFVDGQHDGLLGPLEHEGNLHVGGGDAGAQIGDQNDHLSVVDGDEGLLTHKLQDLVVGPGLDTAGIHHHEGLVAPFGVAVDTVTGNAGGVFHDGVALFGNAVEQQGFAHVGAAHDGDHGFFHNINSLFFSFSLLFQVSLVKSSEKCEFYSAPCAKGAGCPQGRLRDCGCLTTPPPPFGGPPPLTQGRHTPERRPKTRRRQCPARGP